MKKNAEYIIEKMIFLSGVISIVFVVLIFFFLLKEGLALFLEYNPISFVFGRNWFPISVYPK